MGADPGNQSMGVMRATFVGADLTGADLSGANLYKADLSHAKLTKAKLVGTDLRNAELIQTDLTGADLTGARLDKANLDGAIFTGVLGRSEIKGLDQARNRDKAIFDASTRSLAAPIGTALLLAAACAKEQPSPGGQADSTATVAPAGELAYVTNEESQELTVIDTRRDSAVATIPVGTRPRGVRMSPDGKTVFVALSGSPRCPPTMPDEECEKLRPTRARTGLAWSTSPRGR